MGLPDEDTGGGTQSDYQSFGDKVNVEVTDLVSYYEEMTMLSAQAAGAANTAMSQMNMLITTGLATSDDGEAFPEGLQAARFLNHRLSDFQHFTADVTEGVRNIGSAAAVVAELYENSDSENAASVNDIGFVFSDPGARPPGNFRNAETWSEYEQRMAEATGSNAMAAMGDGVPVSYSYSPAAGLTYYHYSDGSYRVVQSRTEPGVSSWTSDSQVLTTTVYGANGQVLSQVTDRSYSVRGSSNVNTTTTSRGDDQNGSTSTTTTVDNPDGTITVTNETRTTTDGQQGEPVTSTTTIQRDQHRDSGPQGPVEDAVEQLDSHGQEHTVRSYGVGY
ncbi:hypothetical protein O7627_20560 [Solwaraspora sp. WMMD1047]|uniref:hypothetical protein n=1 Tax=Solwaraspora sp. WMMD1047 TaxID=3016102 RepID=UPI0024161728|nr:hypothetical protein [Solwaraspora sp. WMMD1047]MDG4831677.1 hypothetical protein [Solwaraspora sp. WMMD1047]